jgi:vacuolar-type H+-ATPase subunit H
MAENAIDQGFNDSELADIMDEIEGLEGEFSTEVDNKPIGESSPDEQSSSADGSSLLDEVGELENTADQEVNQAENFSDLTPPAKNKVKESESKVPAKQSKLDELDGLLNQEFVNGANKMLSSGESGVEKSAAKNPDSYKDAKNKFSIVNDAATTGRSSRQAMNLGDSAAGVSKMEFSLSGSIDLELKFSIADQVINLRVDKNESFIIELGGGMKFTVPFLNSKK